MLSETSSVIFKHCGSSRVFVKKKFDFANVKRFLFQVDILTLPAQLQRVLPEPSSPSGSSLGLGKVVSFAKTCKDKHQKLATFLNNRISIILVKFSDFKVDRFSP